MHYVNPGNLYVQRFGEAKTADDILNYARFLLHESGFNGTPPVDLGQIRARFGIPTPKLAPLKNQQGLLINAEFGIILIKNDDPSTRQRFTEGHEFMELLFSALPSGGGWAARQTGIFKKATKERLCNEGAAELLMPRSLFLPRVKEKGVSFQSARQLAAEFGVSTTAALVQMARIAPGRHAVVLWRSKNKPSEFKIRVPPNQLPLFDGPVAELPPPKLRVEWGYNGPDVSFIPQDKSVPQDSSIYRSWDSGIFMVGEDNLWLGSMKGVFKSENHPFDSDRQRLVISLLHCPGDIDCPA